MTDNSSNQQPVRHGRSVSKSWLTSDGMVRLERRIDSREAVEEVDTFGGFWSVAIADVKPGQLSIQVGRRQYQVQGKTAVFIPPFAVLRWCIQPGQLQFTAFSDDKLANAPELKGCVVLKTIDELPLSPTRRELHNLLNGEGTTHTVALRSDHVIIERAKEMIDRSYHSDHSIGDVASQLNISPATLTRYFKNYYGIAPLAYRNRLRVFESHFRLMRGGNSVAAVGFEVGFDSLRQFNREFKKVIRAVPSAFLGESR